MMKNLRPLIIFPKVKKLIQIPRLHYKVVDPSSSLQGGRSHELAEKISHLIVDCIMLIRACIWFTPSFSVSS